MFHVLFTPTSLTPTWKNRNIVIGQIYFKICGRKGHHDLTIWLSLTFSGYNFGELSQTFNPFTSIILTYSITWRRLEGRERGKGERIDRGGEREREWEGVIREQGENERHKRERWREEGGKREGRVCERTRESLFNDPLHRNFS